PRRGGASPAVRSRARPTLFRWSLRDEIAGEPVQLAPWQARSDEDALGCVLPLVDRRAERVELVQASPFLVRQQKSHVLEALAEPLRDAGAQVGEPFAGERGDLQRVGVAVREAATAERVDRVDLVDDELDGQLLRTDLPQDRVDCGD